MVLKAALRSRRMKIVRRPESATRRRSLILISADSVLWRGRKADWNCLIVR